MEKNRSWESFERDPIQWVRKNLYSLEKEIQNPEQNELPEFILKNLRWYVFWTDEEYEAFKKLCLVAKEKSIWLSASSEISEQALDLFKALKNTRTSADYRDVDERLKLEKIHESLLKLSMKHSVLVAHWVESNSFNFSTYNDFSKVIHTKWWIDYTWLSFIDFFEALRTIKYSYLEDIVLVETKKISINEFINNGNSSYELWNKHSWEVIMETYKIEFKENTRWRNNKKLWDMYLEIYKNLPNISVKQKIEEIDSLKKSKKQIKNKVNNVTLEKEKISEEIIVDSIENEKRNKEMIAQKMKDIRSIYEWKKYISSKDQYYELSDEVYRKVREWVKGELHSTKDRKWFKDNKCLVVDWKYVLKD